MGEGSAKDQSCPEIQSEVYNIYKSAAVESSGGRSKKDVEIEEPEIFPGFQSLAPLALSPVF